MVTFIVDPRNSTITSCRSRDIDTIRSRVGQPRYEVSFLDDELNEYTGTLWPWKHSMHTFEFSGMLYYGKCILVVDQDIKAEDIPIGWSRIRQ